MVELRTDPAARGMQGTGDPTFHSKKPAEKIGTRLGGLGRATS
jgi:hypothetical protein